MLHLESVSIDGFLSHGNTGLLPLDEPGITYIRGATGNGKSTIFEVVYYLLTGETIRKTQQVASLINSVIKGGYDISLNYRRDITKYKVQEVRGRPARTNGLYLYKNGNSEPEPSTGVTDTRRQILLSLGMSPEDFCALAFVGQNQFYTLVYGKSSERAKEMIRIFSLNQYDQALKYCGADVKESSEQRDLLVTKIDGVNLDLKRFEEQLQVEEDEKVAVDEDAITARQAELQRIDKAVRIIRAQYDTAREALGRSKALLEKAELARNITEEVSGLRDQLSKLGPFSEDLIELQTQYDAAMKRLATATAELKQAREQLATVKKLNDRCPINLKSCPVNVPLEYRGIKISQWQASILDGQRCVETSEFSAKEIGNWLEVGKTKSQLQKKISERKKDLNKLGELVVGDSMDWASEVNRLSELLNRGEQKQRKIQDQLTDLQANKAAQLKAQEYRERINKVLEEKRQVLSRYQKDLSDHDKEHQYLVTTLNVLKKAKAYKIDYVINRLNEKLGKNLDYISEGMFQAWFTPQRKDSTGKKLIEDIELMFSDPYKEIPIELASPGQQAYVCLAMIPTVFEVARDITGKEVSSLWLDEVLGPISEDLLDRAFELLVELIRGLGVRSVKIITHRSLDSRFFDHTWDVSLENGVSKVELS